MSEMGAMKCALCPFHLCAAIIGILVTVHAVGAAVFPWHIPWVFMGSITSLDSPPA